MSSQVSSVWESSPGRADCEVTDDYVMVDDCAVTDGYGVTEGCLYETPVLTQLLQ